MNRFATFLLAPVLLFTACTPAASSSSNPAPTIVPLAKATASTTTSAETVAIPTPDWTRVTQMVAATSPGQGDQTLGEMTNWARGASGVRAYLGSQADEMFDLAEQAEAAAAQDLLRQLQPGSKPKGMPAPLPPRVAGSTGTGALESLLSLLSVLLQAPGNMTSTQNGTSNPLTSTNEFDKSVGENARAHAKVTSTVTGSKLEAEVEMTIRIEKDGKVYEEHASGKISVNVCPDPDGNVPLDLSIQTKAGADAGGYGLQFTDHAIGHVDDDANLTSMDQDTQTEISFTKGKNWLTGAPDTTFAQVNARYTLGPTPQNPNGLAISGLQGSVPRSSFLVSQEIVQQAAKTGVDLAMLVEPWVFADAQRKWQNGYCVALAVAEGEEQRVMKGSETPFTATVRHKFEGNELNVPVIATLTGGQVSVTPSGTKVTGPATFRYKAPDKAGGEGATVELVTRSRRGIGRLDVIFKIEESYYNVETAWFGSQITLVGAICALDKPFALKLGGHKPPKFPYDGKVVFTPKDGTSGTWLATGTFSTGGGGSTSDSGGSSYQIMGLAEGKPVIVLHEFTQKSVTTLPPAATRLMHVAPQVDIYHWPGGQIPLTQTTGNCMPMYTGD